MKKYKVFTLKNFREIHQLKQVYTDHEIHTIELVGNVLPFKVNNYVIEELIQWDEIPHDPIFQLTFPQKEMLSSSHYQLMNEALQNGFSKSECKIVANKIRYELNPHPSNQVKNVPKMDGIPLRGMQHKYNETVLFFPSNGQTCHAYCTFCFRWPQFVGMNDIKFAMKETEKLVHYIQQHEEITDVLFTGGDPMIMSAKKFASYIDPIIEANIPHLQTIRIGTKALGYWPYRFTTDNDADELLRVFDKIIDHGYHLAFMAHFNHTRELETDAVKVAIQRILSTGAQIRTQSPIMKNINDHSNTWKTMWRNQVALGCIPYYMFVARDTGAQDYFAVSLDEAFKVFQRAYQQISGLARTVRGPSISCDWGKIQILGINEIKGEKVYALRFIQGRNSNWVGKPFFAQYDPTAIWIDELKPAFGEESFFFEETPSANKFKLHQPKQSENSSLNISIAAECPGHS